MSIVRFCSLVPKRLSTLGLIRIQPSNTSFTSPKSLTSTFSSTSLSQRVTSQIGVGQEKLSPSNCHQVSFTRTLASGPINRPKTDTKDDKEYEKVKEEYQKEKEAIKHTIKFKELDLKEKVKKFYSLYGPLFVICHVTISLASVGFFYTIVYFTVDPLKYIPESIVTMIGEKMKYIAGESSKFVLAYAIHKMTLPLRLGGSIYLTQRLSKTVKFPWLNRAAKSDKN